MSFLDLRHSEMYGNPALSHHGSEDQVESVDSEMSESQESSYSDPVILLDPGMSENRKLRHRNYKDKQPKELWKRNISKGNLGADFTLTTDISKGLLKPTTWKWKNESLKKPSVNFASANADLVDTINIIDTIDRPGDAFAEGAYVGTGAYAISPENEPGKRIPKAGAFAAAGVGRARAEFSIFEAEAKGPNALACAEANVVGAGAMARAEIASASAKIGPVGVKVGLGFDTGVSIGLKGAEVKILGFGFSVGPKTSISLLGSEVSCSVM